MCFEFGKVFEKYVQNAFCIRSNVCEICSEYILWVFFVNENGQSQKAHLPLLLPFVTKIKNSFSENGFWNGKPKHSKCEKQKMKRQKVGNQIPPEWCFSWIIKIYTVSTKFWFYLFLFGIEVEFECNRNLNE